VLQKDQIAIPV